MKLVLKSPSLAPYEAGCDLNVVIAYENSDLARSTWKILEIIGRNFNDRGRVLHQWWDFEVLAFNALRELAAVEVVTADIVIIGIGSGEKLPEMVSAWIKRWLELRKDQPGALVALLDPNVKTQNTTPGIFLQLKNAAVSGRMDFFATQAKLGRQGPGAARRDTEASRQFVLTRRNGAADGLPGKRGGQKAVVTDEPIQPILNHNGVAKLVSGHRRRSALSKRKKMPSAQTAPSPRRPGKEIRTAVQRLRDAS